MEIKEKIYLSVFGNPKRNQGAGSLMGGMTPFRVDYEGYPGVSGEPYYFVLRCDASHTLFKLVCNRVQTSEGHLGTLIIAMSIPKGFQLKNGMSPYNLLLEARKIFQEKYMQPTPGKKEGEEYYTYKPFNEVEENFFEQLIQKYELVPLPLYVPHCQMTGNDNAALQLAPGMIRQLLCNPHYTVFSGYKELVIASVIDPGAYPNRVLSGLEIPNKYSFLLKHSSGRLMNVTLHKGEMPSTVNGVSEYRIEEEDFDKSVEVTSTEDKTYYQIGRTTFIVNELLNGYKRDNMIQLNSGAGIISCSVQGIPIREPYSICLQINGQKSLNHQLVSQLTLNGINVEFVNGTFYIVGEQNRNVSSGKWEVSLQPGSNYVLEATPYILGRELIIGLKKRVMPAIQTDGDYVGNVRPKVSEKNVELVVTMSVEVLDRLGVRDGYVTARIKGGGLTYEPRVRLEADNQGSSKNGKKQINHYPTSRGKKMTGRISLSSSVWESVSASVTIYGNKKQVTSRSPKSLSSAKMTSFEFLAEDISSIIPWYKKIAFYNLFLTPLLLLACGFMAYRQLAVENSKSDATSAQIKEMEEKIEQLKTENRALTDSLNNMRKEITELKKVEPAKNNPQEESAESSAGMEKIKQKIEKLFETGNPKFQDFTFLYSQVFEKPGWNELDWGTMQKFLAYYRISDILLNGDVDAIKKIMAPEHPDIKLLSETHRWQVLAIGYGTNRGEFANNSVGDNWGKRDGINGFVNNRKTRFPSFSSLDAFKHKRNFSEGNE